MPTPPQGGLMCKVTLYGLLIKPAGIIRKCFTGGRIMRKGLIFMFAFFLAGGIFSVNAQDIIILKNGDEIESKVIEISPAEIRYKRFSNLDGPTVAIPAADVSLIIYEDGTQEAIIAKNTTPKAKRAEDFKLIAFGCNFLLGGGIGSFVQGDIGGGVFGLIGELVSWTVILSGRNENSLFFGGVMLSSVRIGEIIRPFTYANSLSVAVSPAIGNNGQLALATTVNLKF
jgi:hypothetical protein